MLGWFWKRLKAMHWAAKLVSVSVLIQAGIYVAQAYQLVNLTIPQFNQLHRAEGRLVLTKQGRDWLTGVEHPDGSNELFSCRRPAGSVRHHFCFMSHVVEKFHLDQKPEVVIWWYPVKVPLEGKPYRYIFQLQLKSDAAPFSYVGQFGNRIEFSYKARADFNSEASEMVQGRLGMALIFVLVFVFIFVWEAFKYETKKHPAE